MRYASAFGVWNFCGGDLNALVNLDRIAINDLTIELQGEFDCQGTFSGSSWTNDGENGFLINLGAHAPENNMRKRITSQSTASTTRPPMICEREKRTIGFGFQVSGFKLAQLGELTSLWKYRTC